MTSVQPVAEPKRSLIRNTLWNLAGTLVPLLIGLVAIPFLLRSLGIERFGMLSLIWMLTGYFGLLDLGLGRALTKLVAEQAEHVHPDELSRLIWTGLALMSVFGAAGAVVLALTAESVVRGLLHVPEALETEAIGATWFLALSLPVTVVSTGLRGVLEGLHLFKLVNLIRLPLGALTFLAPLAVTVFTPDLAVVSASLVGVRLLALAMHAIACVRTLPALARAMRPDRTLCRRLLSFGGWLTASNVVSPLMTYLDRFVIGSLLSLTAVAYYATPYEIVTKLWYVPFSLIGVLFPAFSSSIAQRRPESAVLMVRSIDGGWADHDSRRGARVHHLRSGRGAVRLGCQAACCGTPALPFRTLVDARRGGHRGCRDRLDDSGDGRRTGLALDGTPRRSCGNTPSRSARARHRDRAGGFAAGGAD